MKKLFLLATLLAIFAAACGSDTSDTSDVEPAAPDASNEVVDSHPTRIISLSPTATEILFAIGAGDQVIAVDSFSYFPEEAPVTDLSAYEPNIEAIAAFEPDLVVLTGGGQEELEALGVRVVAQLAAVTIEDVYDQITELGIDTGNEDGAAELIASMRSDISEILAQLPERDEPLTYFHELDDTLYSVTSTTFIGAVYEMAGLVNIADPADEDGSAFGYPQLTQEYILDSDPDFIFLADAQCCAQSPAVVGDRPGWAELAAVQNGRVIEVDADIASRWGPRVVDYLRAVVDAVVTAPAG